MCGGRSHGVHHPDGAHPTLAAFFRNPERLPPTCVDSARPGRPGLVFVFRGISSGPPQRRAAPVRCLHGRREHECEWVYAADGERLRKQCVIFCSLALWAACMHTCSGTELGRDSTGASWRATVSRRTTSVFRLALTVLEAPWVDSALQTPLFSFVSVCYVRAGPRGCCCALTTSRGNHLRAPSAIRIKSASEKCSAGLHAHARCEVWCSTIAQVSFFRLGAFFQSIHGLDE